VGAGQQQQQQQWGVMWLQWVLRLACCSRLLGQQGPRALVQLLLLRQP
jgi:hypothetical protein